MSVGETINDVLHGNFSHAEARVEDWWDNSLSPGFKLFITKVKDDEGKILQGLVAVAARDVLAGGFTTASFVTAALDVGSKLLAQNIVMLQTDIFAALNIEVASAATTSGAPAPTNAA
jgi:hypothetical protein